MDRPRRPEKQYVVDISDIRYILGNYEDYIEGLEEYANHLEDQLYVFAEKLNEIASVKEEE